jgi:hypothetical protein
LKGDRADEAIRDSTLVLNIGLVNFKVLFRWAFAHKAKQSYQIEPHNRIVINKLAEVEGLLMPT